MQWRSLWRQLTGGLLAGVLLSAPMWLRSETPQTASEPLPPATTAPSAATDTYYALAGEWEGRLAIFLPNEDAPAQVYDVYLASLPDEEQTRLRAGIPLADEVELAKLIEDYGS